MLSSHSFPAWTSQWRSWQSHFLRFWDASESDARGSVGGGGRMARGYRLRPLRPRTTTAFFCYCMLTKLSVLSWQFPVGVVDETLLVSSLRSLCPMIGAHRYRYRWFFLYRCCVIWTTFLNKHVMYMQMQPVSASCYRHLFQRVRVENSTPVSGIDADTSIGNGTSLLVSMTTDGVPVKDVAKR